MSNDEIIKLTKEMEIASRSSAKDLGKLLVKANRLGLKLINGGNRSAPSRKVAEELIKKLGR